MNCAWVYTASLAISKYLNQWTDKGIAEICQRMVGNHKRTLRTSCINWQETKKSFSTTA